MTDRAPPPSPALAEALARLELSRAHLRHHMIPPPPPPAPPGESGVLPARLRAWWRQMRRQKGGWPIGSVVAAALGEWWHQHPWRPAGEALAGELKASALPVLRRHPVLAVLAAAGLGAFLVTQRPWRWPGVAERVRPMPRQLGRWAMRQLAQAPVQTALMSLLLLLLKPREEAPPAPEPIAPAEAPRQPSPTPTPDGG